MSEANRDHGCWDWNIDDKDSRGIEVVGNFCLLPQHARTYISILHILYEVMGVQLLVRKREGFLSGMNESIR